MSFAARGAGICASTVLLGCIRILGYGEGTEFGPCSSATDCPPGEVCAAAHRCAKPPVTTVSMCTPSCALTELCSNSVCYPGTPYGYSAGGTSAVTVHTAQVVECIQLRVPDCGFLTAVGIVTHLDVYGDFRFAVYDDESSSGESGYYWICFASSSEYVSLETTQASGLWAEGAALEQIPGYLDSGLPDMSPTSGLTQSATTAALIYAWIAKPK